jgi:hypothetical protein
MRKVGWTSTPPYGGQRVSPRVSLFPGIKPSGALRRRANSFRPMGRIPKRRGR